jgi:hypothetical protein
MEAWQHLTKVVNHWVNPKTYTGTIVDANDGTGDGILTFDPELVELFGWEEGDKLDLTVDPDGIIIVSRIYD